MTSLIKYTVSLASFCFVLTNTPLLISALAPQGNSDFRPPQAIDGSRRTADQTGDIANSNAEPATSLTESLSSGPNDSQGQRVFDALFNELDNMIPGDFADDSEQKKAIENAVTAFQVQDINRVSEIFKELETNNKNFPPADLLMAALSYAIKDAESGLLLLERTAVNHPDYPGVYSAFARLAINEGRVSDALAMFEKCGRKIGAAAELDSVSREYFEQQCLDGLIDVAMQQKRYDDARNYLERQRKTLAENAKVMMVSAELEFHQGQIEKSVEYLTQLKTKFPQTRSPESVLASWYQQTGKADEAEKWIRQAAEKYTDDPQVQLEFASWAVNEEDFPTASSAIIKAEKASSESLYSRSLKGKIAFCNQSYGVAESHFKFIAEQQPNNFDSINMYALCLIESKDPEKQKMARDIAIRNFRALPDNLVAQAALGYIELKLGSNDQAKAILTRVARTPGTAPEMDYFLASLLEKVGEREQAKIVLDAALKHEGIFLYRSAAQELLKNLQSSSDALPNPK